MSTEAQKYNLIKKITEIQDEVIISKLTHLLNEYSSGDRILLDILKPMRENLDIEELKMEQKYQGFDKNEVQLLIKELDLQEPLEKLLEDI